MNPRISRHAEILVNHSVSVNKGDKVMIASPPQASELVEQLAHKIGEKKAVPMVVWWYDGKMTSAYKKGFGEGDFPIPEHFLEAIRESDAYIGIKAPANVKEGAEISSEVSSSYSQSMEKILEAQLDTEWTVTQHPTDARAQEAGMSIREYEDFLYGAIDRDWQSLKDYQSQLADIIEGAGKLEIQSGDDTHLEMSIDGMHSGQENGTKNLPGSEVATAPVIDSVNGKVKFDYPVIHSGKEITEVELVFEDGEVIEFSAEENEEVLESIVEADEGSKRLGEVGFGMNSGIDRFTANIYLDEKMAKTVHLALGQAYEEEVGEGREVNNSAVHVDMLINMRKNSEIRADGNTIYRNGKYIFDEGFEN